MLKQAMVAAVGVGAVAVGLQVGLTDSSNVAATSAPGINKTASVQPLNGFGFRASAPLPGLATKYTAYPQTSSFIPLAVWYMQPTRTGDQDNATYTNEAAAAAAIGINTLEGVGPAGEAWPEAYGADAGELAAVKAAGLRLMAGGPNIDAFSSTSAQSVNSILALTNSLSAQSTVIGYMGPDEPHCNGGGPFTADMPGLGALVASQDPTRPLLINQTSWMLNPGNINGVDTSSAHTSCLTSLVANLSVSSVASADLYPIVNAWDGNGGVPFAAHSDYAKISNDMIFQQAIDVYHLAHFAPVGSPIWMYVEAGGDALGSEQNNKFFGATVSGSTTLTMNGGGPRFSPTWNGLTVSGSGIPPGTTITYIDAAHAALSQAATATASNVYLVPTGGVVFHGTGSSCIAAVNLCLTTGQEYRPTPAQVGAEAWMSLISGAVGIEWFCQDGISQAFCLGGNDGSAQGKADAQLVAQNLTYLNATFKSFAGPLNGAVVGQCLMDSEDYVTDTVSTHSSCAGGILTMATNNPAVPGLAIVKANYGLTFLFAQSDRRSVGGSAFTFTLSGLGGKTATVIYDSNARYDPAHSALRASTALNSSGAFTDWLGAYGDDYQVKVYLIA